MTPRPPRLGVDVPASLNLVGALTKYLSLAAIFPVAVATMVGIRSVDARLLELGRSLRATRRQILTTLEIPAATTGLTLMKMPKEWAGTRRSAKRSARNGTADDSTPAAAAQARAAGVGGCASSA